MPETAVHKADDIVFREDDVGLAGESLVVQKVSDAVSMQGAAQDDLGASVLIPNACHHAGSGLLVHYVWHGFGPSASTQICIQIIKVDI